MASLKSASGGVFGYVAAASLKEGCEFRNIRYKIQNDIPFAGGLRQAHCPVAKVRMKGLAMPVSLGCRRTYMSCIVVVVPLSETDINRDEGAQRADLCAYKPLNHFHHCSKRRRP